MNNNTQPDMNSLMYIPGIPGQIYDYKVITSLQEMSQSSQAEDIDIKKMARWAMNYLLRSPRVELNYEPIFSCSANTCPPVPDGHDPIVYGDTDSRMDWEFYHMRDISGAEEGKSIEAAFHKRIRNYLGKFDICWTEPGGFLSDNIPSDIIVGNLWATTKLLVSLSLSYRHTNDQNDKQLARRVFEGLRNAASSDGRYSWYPSGFGPVDDNLKPIALNWPSTAPLPIVEALVVYWKTFNDAEALELAIACANSIVDNYPKLNLTHIESDGSFVGHTHTTLHAMWGIAHLGVETGNSKYMEFSKRIYEFMIKHGTGTGWLHENITSPDSRNNCSETCTTSDVMSIIACLAQSHHFMGDDYLDYYDHLERYFRNHILPCQFFVTPKFEAYYRDRHKDKPKAMVDKGIESLKKMQGGILAGGGINDYINEVPGDERTNFILVGCCAAEGIRAIHTTWENIVTDDTVNGRNVININMSLPVETDSVRVISYLPNSGMLTAIAKVNGDFKMRPPAWTVKSAIRVWRNEKEAETKFSDKYVIFDDVRPGEKLTISYPLIEYKQNVSIFEDESLTAVYTWRGSTAINVDPSGKYFPMHNGERVVIPPFPDLPD